MREIGQGVSSGLSSGKRRRMKREPSSHFNLTRAGMWCPDSKSVVICTSSPLHPSFPSLLLYLMKIILLYYLTSNFFSQKCFLFYFFLYFFAFISVCIPYFFLFLPSNLSTYLYNSKVMAITQSPLIYSCHDYLFPTPNLTFLHSTHLSLFGSFPLFQVCLLQMF